MTDEIYDLLIIGGGINGASIARDAAGRGLSVLLCEMGDLAGATSSASSKLIHGGLRYLEQYAFRLVAESLRERRVLLHNAPHIIRPLEFVMPHVPAAIAAYEQKLITRLRDAIQNGEIQDTWDERIRQELALFATKIDVDEELSRLASHLSEMRRILTQGGTVGKRLDFLMQELNREANTLGSKSVDAEVSRTAMEMKILIEQMREQIQNLE